jgi:hypothetical protein
MRRFGVFSTPKRLRLAALASVLASLASTGLAATPVDTFNRDIAAHPYVGRLYVRAFKAGVRIPVEFRGEWSSDKKTCGIEGDDYDTRIFVEAVTVHYSDETHVATAVKRVGPHSVAITYGPLKKGYHYMSPPPIMSLESNGAVLQGWDESGKTRWNRWMKCPVAPG